MRGIALWVVLVPLCWIAFELVLALFGVGDEAEHALLPYQNLATPLFDAAGDGAGARFVAREERLGSRAFAVQKPPELVRVVCLGGSAMRGLGYSPNASIPGYLERGLNACAPAGRRFEVLNWAVVGISSRQVRDMCADAVALHSPDLVVVCTGNNEFLELHARKYRELGETGLGGVLSRVQGLRSFHLLSLLLPRQAPIGPSAEEEIRLTASEFVERVEITEPEVRAVLAEYRSNLEETASICRTAGVPLVLMTEPANLRWNDPHPEEDWDERVLAEWQIAREAWPATRAERLALVLAEVEKRLAGAAGSERSALAFLRAKCEEERGDLEAARRSYILAQDADPRRRRTTTEMHAIVSSVAEERGAHLFDTVAFFRGIQTIPDFRLLYDHIHYTPEGALRVAGRLAAEVLALLLPEVGDRSPALAAFQDETLERLAERLRLGEDFPAADEWVGFCFDPALVADRDLWKYERQLQELRTLVAARDAPNETAVQRGKALTYLGNALSFLAGKQGEARACYEQALELVPEWDAVLRHDLELLRIRASQ